MDRGSTFDTGTYTVTRTDPETFDDAGVRIPGAETTFNIAAGVQPISGVDMQSLVEGESADDYRAIFTLTALRTRGPDGEADRITIDSGDGQGPQVYTVMSVKKRAVISNYWRAVATRSPPAGGP